MRRQSLLVHKPLDGRCSVNHLQSFKASARILPVRCGSLTGASHHGRVTTNPEFLAGLCGQTEGDASVRLPSQGPAPLSTWGFSLGECFVGGTLEGGRLRAGDDRRYRVRAPYSSAWSSDQAHPQSICTDRTTPVRSGLEWGASQKHRAWNQDQAGPSQPRHRDCKKLAVIVTSSTARDVNGPSWELESFKAEELGRLEKVTDDRSPCCSYD